MGIGVWLSLGFLVFEYIHPLAAVVPAWLLSSALMNIFVVKTYFKRLITRVEVT